MRPGLLTALSLYWVIVDGIYCWCCFLGIVAALIIFNAHVQ